MKLDIQLFGLDQWLSDSNGNEIYWRKANQIHHYFIGICGYEKGDNGRCCVKRKDLETLLFYCNVILNDPTKAPSLLPTCPGFFFGSYDYDSWYFDQIKDTKEQLENLLASKKPHTKYYYSSWW